MVMVITTPIEALHMPETSGCKQMKARSGTLFTADTHRWDTAHKEQLKILGINRFQNTKVWLQEHFVIMIMDYKRKQIYLNKEVNTRNIRYNATAQI